MKSRDTYRNAQKTLNNLQHKNQESYPFILNEAKNNISLSPILNGIMSSFLDMFPIRNLIVCPFPFNYLLSLIFTIGLNALMLEFFSQPAVLNHTNKEFMEKEIGGTLISPTKHVLFQRILIIGGQPFYQMATAGNR